MKVMGLDKEENKTEKTEFSDEDKKTDIKEPKKEVKEKKETKEEKKEEKKETKKESPKKEKKENKEVKKEKKEEKNGKAKKVKKTSGWRWVILALIVVIALLLYNYNVVFNNSHDEVVATVGNQDITLSELDYQYNRLPPEYQMYLTKPELLDRLIGFSAMKQEATKLGYSVSDDEIESVVEGYRGQMDEEEFENQVNLQYGNMKNFKREIGDMMLIQKLAMANVPELNVTDEEVQTAFEQYSIVLGEESVEASHILICYEGATGCTENYTKEKALAKIRSTKRISSNPLDMFDGGVGFTTKK